MSGCFYQVPVLHGVDGDFLQFHPSVQGWFQVRMRRIQEYDVFGYGRSGFVNAKVFPSSPSQDLCRKNGSVAAFIWFFKLKKNKISLYLLSINRKKCNCKWNNTLYHPRYKDQAVCYFPLSFKNKGEHFSGLRIPVKRQWTGRLRGSPLEKKKKAITLYGLFFE